MQVVKAELLIFVGFILILSGTVVLEKPFIIRIYEKAASFGLLCDIALPGDTDIIRTQPDEELHIKQAAAKRELVKARSYNMSIYAIQNRQGFIYEDTYTDPDYNAILNGPHGMMCVSLPVGGPSAHAVIAAHSGLVDRELFTHLPEMQPGDEFNIYVLSEKHTYKVDKITTCLPSETEALKVARGEDMITLMTCVPYGINSHRLFVRGVRCMSGMNTSAADLLTARRREYVRSVLYIAGMFLTVAVETALYAIHVHTSISRIRTIKKGVYHE